MRSLDRLCGLAALVALALIATDAYAALSASVESRTISESDTLELYVRCTREGDDSPDWSALEKSFDVLATRSATQVRSINGKVDTERTWVLRLRPHGAGTFEVPAFELGGERSQPITITVKPLDPAVRRAIDELVFFEVEHSPDAVYVHGQLLLTRRLYYADGTQLYGELPGEPVIADAVVHSLGEPRASTDFRNGRRYGVLEQSFAVFPEQSGKLHIPAAVVSGSVTVAIDSGALPRRTGVQVSSKALDVEVLPIPREYPSNQPWLPATNVEIVEAWEHDPPALKVGEPITRTLIVRADANDASIIPPLATGTVAAKTYSSPPEQNETTSAKGVIGTRTESITLVATAPGKLVLPPISLTWWDTAQRSVHTAEVPGRTLYVAPAPGGSLPALEPSTVAPQPQPATPPATVPSSETQSPVVTTPGTITWLTWLLALTTLACAIGWIVTWRRARLAAPLVGTNPRSRLIAPDARAAERAAFDALRRAASVADLSKLRAALTTWARQRAAMGTDPLTDTRLRNLVGELDACLYGPEPNGSMALAPLLERVNELRSASSAIHAADDALPSLYFTSALPGGAEGSTSALPRGAEGSTPRAPS
jgi:hypothetical protein